MSTVLLTRIGLGEVQLRILLGQALNLPGLILTDAAAIAWCAANAVNLKGANLSGCDFDGSDISGLWAPNSNCQGSTFRNAVANRLVNGRRLELSAAQLQGAIFTGSVLTVANLACTHPTNFRVETGPNTRLRGIDWTDCPDVVVLPVRDDQAGKVIAVKNGSGWKIHAGDRGVMLEAAAKQALEALPDPDLATQYRAAFSWLESPEGIARKQAVESGRAVEAGAD